MIDKKKLAVPEELLKGLFDNEFVPEFTQLNDADFDPEKILENIKQDIDKKIESVQTSNIFDTEIRRPLTPAEAEVLDKEIASLLGEVANTKKRIGNLLGFIDDQAGPSGGGTAGGQSEVAFSLDIEGKRMLKRAVKVVFGEKVDTISYSMYLAAKAAKKKIEEEEVKEYTSGAWGNK